VARILRGEIRWADLDPVRGREQAGHRPVLVLSHEVFNAHSGTVIAVALTGREPRAAFPLIWPIPAGVLTRPAWAKISQIRTLSVDRLGRRLGQLDEVGLTQVMEGLREILGE
jgi:mRNA interferase MazF